MTPLKMPPLPVVLEKPKRASVSGKTLNTSLLMSRLKTSRRLARVILPVVAVLFSLVSDASHGTSYLSSVGPPNLRFEPIHDRGIIVPTLYAFADSMPVKAEVSTAAAGAKPDMKPEAKPESKPVASTPEIVIFPPSTNGTVITSSSPIILPTQPPPPTPGGFYPPSGPNDNTIVTPEMLLDYLRPARGGTGNAAQVPGDAPMRFGFVPPTPMTDKSSQSVYKKE
jgi:hypothetical protein